MRTHRPKTLLSALLLAAMAATGVSAAPELYKPTGRTCGGFPRAPIDMAPGFCAGLVVAPTGLGMKARQMRLPRTLLSLGTGKDWLVSDLGAWTPGLGAVWLSNEAVGVLPDVATSLSPGDFVLVRDGTELVARADPHGTWMEWLAR